jgi:ferrous iron transport protein B
MGKSIEPAISLGYDWKIGIAIISSLLREKSLGTLATIYSVGSNEDTIKIKMARSQSNHEEGVQLASGISLLLFYAFALQCANYDRDEKKPTPEMAARATYLNECVCIHSSSLRIRF